MSKQNNLVGRLFRGRFRGENELRKIIDGQQKKPANAAPASRYIKGIHKGNYFKIKLPARERHFPNVPKIPPPNPVPKPFVSVKGSTPSSEEIRHASNAIHRTFSRRFWGWSKANWAVLVLNFGSICTFVGFTRSDILELRSLSMTGSIASVIYVSAQERLLWPPVVWSTLFAAINGVKIYQILQERNAKVQMTVDEEEVFVKHFMPHGVTPKQFERITKNAKRIFIKKGEFLVRKGEPLDTLLLVVKGSTRAHVLGRHLTAASTGPATKGHKQEGGDSGAWVGEMAFLDYYWDKQQGSKKEEQPRTSIYTIFADSDCEVLSWSHDEMEKLMATSTDLRAALTRAMTSAVVGKVVNMTISRSTKVLPNWSTWLSDWRNNDVKIHSMQRLPEDNEEFRRRMEELEENDGDEGDTSPNIELA